MTELVRRLDPRRWEVHLACVRADGAWFARASENVASVGTFPIVRFAHTSTMSQMRMFGQWCRDRRIALVHTAELYSNIIFLPAAALAGVPVRIGSRREIAAGKTRGQIALQRAAYGCAHHIVANAEAVATRLRREWVPAQRISVIPNGLDLSRFSPRPLPTTLTRIAMVANLRPGKGHDTLIDALPLLLARFPDVRVDLIGNGTERAALEQRVGARGLASVIRFVGHAEDVGAHLSESHLFTLPSESEAFPNAVLEAMAAGLPVVSTAVGGIREVVEHGRTGLLVPPRDPRALADALASLIADPTRAQALASQGRALVERRYSFDRMVRSMEDLYDQQLTRRMPERAAQSQFASL